MTERNPGAFRSTAIDVVAFGVAMGYLEAAVVVNLLAAVETGAVRLERLAWAAVVFGAWDIVYYVGLRLAIGWPSSFDTWDVLFLIPGPWLAPVWAPIMVSAALVGAGLTAARRLRAGRSIAVGPARALAALAGGGLVILSFLAEPSRVVAGESVAWTGWPLCGAGMALATVATVSALAGRSTARAMSGHLLQHDPGRRPSVGAPD
jgi:hypothetical protein